VTRMDEPSARTFGDALRHRGLLLLAIIIAFVLAGGFVSRSTPPTYDASARLFLEVGDTEGAQLSREQLGRYFIQLARSRVVLEGVIAELKLSQSTPEMLAKRVRGEIVRGTGIVAVHAEAPTGSGAASLANAVAKAIIQYYKAEVAGRFKPIREYLDAELVRLDAAIQQVRAEVIPPFNVTAQANHQAQLSALQSQYDAIYSRRQDIALSQGRAQEVTKLLEPAATPLKPSRPDPVLYLAAAVVAGFSVGLLVILLLERFDDRLFSTEDLARAAGTPVVMSAPRASRRALSGRQLAPYQVARAHLVARRPGTRSVMIAAASTRDRSDYVAAQLGAVAADSGQRVLVVHTESLSGRQLASLNGSLWTTVPVASPNDTHVAMEALDELGGRYDFAVLSVGSPDTNPSAFSLARSADLAVLVATAGVTRFADARRAAEALRQAGIDLVACFLLSDGSVRR